MSESDGEIDLVAHERLIASINNLGKSTDKRKTVTLKKHVPKVSANELVSAIHSTRNLQDVKKDLQKKKKNSKEKESFSVQTLQVPLHRQARERIERGIAYNEIRKDLDVWTSVVQKNRLADQLSFPLEVDNAYVQPGGERKQNFTPRTALEIELASVLGTTKNNLGNEDSYTEAEKELIKAMNVKEAKAKCAQLQKMRALMSYREAKLKRQAKIKSKSYHRHLKRQKRKQLIKEFDELLVKDPEAAKEKLAEIEQQRILERATLKHRNGSKRMQLLARHAAKDPAAKKALEDQIRLGRELAEKHGLNEDSETSGDETEELSTQQLIEKVAEMAAKEDVLESSATNPSLLSDLRKMRNKEKLESKKSAIDAANILKKLENDEAVYMGKSRTDWEVVNWDASEKNGSESEEPEARSETKEKEAEAVRDLANTELEDRIDKPKRKRKPAKEASKKVGLIKKLEKKKMRKDQEATERSIDALFDEAEDCLMETAMKVAEEELDIDVATTSEKDSVCKVRRAVNGSVLPGTSGSLVKTENKSVAVERGEIDISLDPRHFLQVETKALTQVSAELMEKVDEFDAQGEQVALIAEAFKDDDVIESFEAEKAAAEEAEKPKDIDLTLAGWGSWTGPGISQKRNERFVIKAKQKKRRDQGRYGVIITERTDSSIEKAQLRSVPFPYTTVEDYEAVVRQPIGKDWNTPGVFHNMTKPTIVTKSGRIIKPLDKESVLKEVAKEVSDDEH